MAINLSDLKNEISRAGSNKSKFLFLKEGAKVRIRFLTEFTDGVKVPFHDSYTEGINVPCQEVFGRNCAYCDNENLRTRNLYAWSYYDYESSEVKIMLFAVNNCTPVGALASYFETYGTILDRDYEIKRMGSSTSTSYSVIPLDKSRFRNAKVRAMSEQAIMKTIDKAYPCEDVEEDEEEGAETGMNEPEESGEEWEEDYEQMKPKELYKLCIERGIDCEQRMSKKYYIDLLTAGDDW